MSEDRIANENLRRRFEQNQEDCTYTVLALLPTIRDEIIGALPVEQISNELQQQRADRLARSVGASDAASSDFPSAPPSVTDDGSSYVHASQMAESGVGGDATAPPLRSKKSKLQLWNDMKISSTTRAITLLYTLSLLTLLTRIQLNLLGRRTYLSSVVSLASPPPPASTSRIALENNDDDNYDNAYGNDFETNRKYLTFSWWLLHRGCKDILNKVTAAVKEALGPVKIKEEITLEQLSELVLQVRRKIEGATEEERRAQNWLSYLLPPRDQEDFVLRESGMGTPDSPPLRHTSEDPFSTASSASPPAAIADHVSTNPSLRRLIDETSDLIDSPTFTHVLTLVLDAAFSHLVDIKIAQEAYKLSAPATLASSFPADITSESRIQEVLTDEAPNAATAKCKVANILPVFCRQAHTIAAGGNEGEGIIENLAVAHVPNEYLAAIDQVRELEAFAAVVYSSNFEFEAASVETAEAPGAHVITNSVLVETAEPEAAEQLGESEVLVGRTDDHGNNSDGASAQTETLPKVTAADEDFLALTDVPNKDSEPDKAVPGGSGFESAWEKALAKEDGIKLDEPAQRDE
ncbi:peroxin [Elasticomyces elasticus]|nr:peroxin [Elasticomyces elasticus]